MTAAPARTVYDRVHAVLADLPAIGKNRTAPGSMGGYAFRGIEDITAELKPALAKHGVFMVPAVIERRESERAVGQSKTMYVVDLSVRFTFYGPDGDSFVAEMWGEGTDMGDKATQKAVTAAFKSMLTVTFCIGDGELDAEAHSVPETEQRSAPSERFDYYAAPLATKDELTRIGAALKTIEDPERRKTTADGIASQFGPAHQMRASDVDAALALIAAAASSRPEGEQEPASAAAGEPAGDVNGDGSEYADGSSAAAALPLEPV